MLEWTQKGGDMQRYHRWLTIVEELVEELSFGTGMYVSQTNLRWLYERHFVPEEAVYLVLEVAARHGNADAKETLKEKERRGIGI